MRRPGCVHVIRSKFDDFTWRGRQEQIFAPLGGTGFVCVRRYLQPAGEEGAFGDDGGVALGASGDHANFDLQEITDETHVVERSFGQFARIFHTVSLLLPAGKCFVDWRDLFIFLGECGHFVDGRAFVFVAGANLDFALCIEDVEFGDDERINAVDHFGVAKNGEVEPATAARTAGDGTEFVSALTNCLRVEVRHFGREWPAADARRVGLRYPEDMPDFCGRDANTSGCAAARSAGAGDVRIRAVVDVEHRTLRA